MSDKKPLVILDRDGVINEASYAYIKSADEWLPIPGSIPAIARLKQAGFQVVIATNQSGLARGLFAPCDLEAMHNKFEALLAEQGVMHDGIFFCPHGPDDNCLCRKPLPGLVSQIEASLEISAKDAYFVGDSLRDLQAANAGKCKPVLVKTGKGQATYNKIMGDESLGFSKIPIYESLNEFVINLLSS